MAVRSRVPMCHSARETWVLHARVHLAAYKAPSHVETVAQLPRNASGEGLEANLARTVLARAPAPRQLNRVAVNHEQLTVTHPEKGSHPAGGDEAAPASGE
jgi:hypothetical protein